MLALLPLLFLLSLDLGSKADAARRALSAGDFQSAILLYRDLSAAFPRDPAIRTNLGLAFHSAGQYAAALEQFELVLRAKPGHRAALLFSGVDLLKLDKPAKALQRLSELLARDSDNRIALLELGHAHQAMGDFGSAEKAFLRLCDLDPANPQAWYALGANYWSSAKHEFEWIETNQPFTAQWYALLARSQQEQGKYVEAFQRYREALSRSPHLLAVHSGLAEVYRQTGHPDWASQEDIREAEIGRADASSAVDVHYRKALEDQQKAYDALNHLSRLAESVELHDLLGQAYRMQQLDSKSAEEFGRAWELDKGNVKIAQELATSLWLSRDVDAALPILENLIKIDPMSPELNHLLGDCFLQKNQPEKAIPFLEIAVRNGKMLPAQASLGRAYLHTGQYAQAIAHLQQALPLNDGPLFFQLAEAHRKLRHTFEANRYLAEFKRRLEASRDARISESNIRIAPP